MRELSTLALWMSLALVFVAPHQANAQVVATSFEDLRPLVKSGDTIDVTEANGRKTRARLGELTQSSLEILVRKTGPDGRETFVPQSRLAERDVRQIQIIRGDSVLNGTLIGLAVVGGPWLLACNPATDWCYYNDGANLYRVIALITSGIGAGIGALIDAGIRERVLVYYQPPTRGSSGIGVSPFASKSAAGMQLTWRF
jgi:hypothetical protein